MMEKEEDLALGLVDKAWEGFWVGPRRGEAAGCLGRLTARSSTLGRGRRGGG